MAVEGQVAVEEEELEAAAGVAGAAAGELRCQHSSLSGS